MIPTETRNKLPKLLLNSMDELNVSGNTTDEATFLPLLVIANTPIQALYNVETIVTTTWKSAATSIFGIVLQDSGGKKSANLAAATEGIDFYQRDTNIKYKQELRQYLVDLASYKASQSKTPDPTIPPPDKPINPIVAYKKATVNGIIRALLNRGYIGIHNSDALEFFSSYSMSAKNGGGDEMISMLSDVWSGGNISHQTGVDENNVNYFNRRINIIFLIQSQVANFLKSATMQDQGIINRMLITQAKSQPHVNLTLQDVLKMKHQNKSVTSLEAFSTKVEALLNKADAEQISKRNNNSLIKEKFTRYELVLDTLKFNTQDSSYKVMLDYYNKTKMMAEDKEISQKWSGFLLRAYEHALRLAANFAVIDSNVESATNPVINEVHAECAVEIMDWLFEARTKLTQVGSSPINSTVSAADDLYDWITETVKVGESITKNKLNIDCPHIWKKLSVKERLEVIQQLISNDVIAVEQRTGPNACKPTTLITRLM